MRDSQKQEKLRVFKVIHAVVHKRVFVFYQKPEMFRDVAGMITKVFRFEQANFESSRDSSSFNLEYR